MGWGGGDKRKGKRSSSVLVFKEKGGKGDFCLSRGLEEVYKRQRWTQLAQQVQLET